MVMLDRMTLQELVDPAVDLIRKLLNEDEAIEAAVSHIAVQVAKQWRMEFPDTGGALPEWSDEDCARWHRCEEEAQRWLVAYAMNVTIDLSKTVWENGCAV